MCWRGPANNGSAWTRLTTSRRGRLTPAAASCSLLWADLPSATCYTFVFSPTGSRRALRALAFSDHPDGRRGCLLHLPPPLLVLRHAIPVILESVMAPFAAYYQPVAWVEPAGSVLSRTQAPTSARSEACVSWQDFDSRCPNRGLTARLS